MFEVDIEDLMVEVTEDITIFLPVIPIGGSDEYGDSLTTFTEVASNAYFAVNRLVRERNAETEIESFFIYIPYPIYSQYKKIWTRGSYIMREEKRYDIIDVDVSNKGLSRAVLIGIYTGADDNYDTI